MQNKVEIPPPKKKITGEILFEKGMVVLVRKHIERGLCSSIVEQQ